MDTIENAFLLYFLLIFEVAETNAVRYTVNTLEKEAAILSVLIKLPNVIVTLPRKSLSTFLQITSISARPKNKLLPISLIIINDPELLCLRKYLSSKMPPWPWPHEKVISGKVISISVTSVTILVGPPVLTPLFKILSMVSVLFSSILLTKFRRVAARNTAVEIKLSEIQSLHCKVVAALQKEFTKLASLPLKVQILAKLEVRYPIVSSNVSFEGLLPLGEEQ